jgi:hypothetical protein
MTRALALAALLSLALAVSFSARYVHAQTIACLSPAQLMQFLHITGLPFEGVPGGVLVHAEAGTVFYALTGGLYCIRKGEPA